MSLARPGESEALGVGSAIDDYPGGLTLSETPRLRIAVAPLPLPPGLPVDAEFQRAVTGAAEVLGDAGHTVVNRADRMPSWLAASAVATWFACARGDVEGLDPRRMERRTRSLARAGRLLARFGADGATGRDRWRAHGADQWFGNADVLVMPTLAAPPPPAERWGRRGLAANARVNLTYAPATAAWNIAGWPAMSVPYGMHSCGVPIGVQLVAAPGGESQLLALAGRLEAERPWTRHAPLP
jgi:amidase